MPQGRKGHARRLILARATLMWPFQIGMGHELLGHLAHLLQRGRPVHLETLLMVAENGTVRQKRFYLGAEAGRYEAQYPGRAKSVAVPRENPGHWNCLPI